MISSTTFHTPLLTKTENTKPQQSFCSKFNEKIENGLAINRLRKNASTFFHQNCEDIDEKRLKAKEKLMTKIQVSHNLSSQEINSIITEFISLSAIAFNDLEWEKQNEASIKLEELMTHLLNEVKETPLSNEHNQQKIYQCILTTGIQMTYLPRPGLLKFCVTLKRFFVPIAFILHEWVGVLFAKTASPTTPYSVSLIETLLVGMLTVNFIETVIDSVFISAEKEAKQNIRNLVSKLLPEVFPEEKIEKSYFLVDVCHNFREKVIEDFVSLFHSIGKILCICSRQDEKKFTQRNTLLFIRAAIYATFDTFGDSLGLTITKMSDASDLDENWKNWIDYGGSLLAGVLSVIAGLSVYLSFTSCIEMQYPAPNGEQKKEIQGQEILKEALV